MNSWLSTDIVKQFLMRIVDIQQGFPGEILM